MYECLVALLSKPSQINGAILPGDRDTLYQLLLLVTTYIYYHNIKLLQEEKLFIYLFQAILALLTYLTHLACSRED